MSGRRFLPWILSFGLVLVFAVAAVIALNLRSPGGTTAAGGPQALSSSPQALSSSSQPAPASAQPALASAQPASPPGAHPHEALAQVVVSSPATRLRSKNGRVKGDNDPIADKAGEIAARYERGPQYQIKVGASPSDVRAGKPINLYIPPRDPMYNITGHIASPPTSTEGAFIHWMVTHTPQKDVAFLREKWNLAQQAIQRGYLTHQRVLSAFLLTPREWFVRAYNYKNAYEQTSLPIGYGQTITDPETVIAMTNALDPQPNQRVLEVGTGSGYQSAFLSELTNYVYTMEIVRPLGEETNQIYKLHTHAMPQYANIHRRLGDGYYGWPRYAPFARIIVTAGIDHIPPDLLKQLAPGGIMIIPVGPPTGQTILLVRKTVGPHGHIHLTRRDIYHGYAKTIFVPFTASGGSTHNTGVSSAG